MSELQEIKKDLTFLYTIFIVLFVIFGVVQSVVGWQIMTDVHAFNQCQSVDDEHFKACYDDKRK